MASLELGNTLEREVEEAAESGDEVREHLADVAQERGLAGRDQGDLEEAGEDIEAMQLAQTMASASTDERIGDAHDATASAEAEEAAKPLEQRIIEKLNDPNFRLGIMASAAGQMQPDALPQPVSSEQQA